MLINSVAGYLPFKLKRKNELLFYRDTVLSCWNPPWHLRNDPDSDSITLSTNTFNDGRVFNESILIDEERNKTFPLAFAQVGPDVTVQIDLKRVDATRESSRGFNRAHDFVLISGMTGDQTYCQNEERNVPHGHIIKLIAESHIELDQKVD